MHSGDVSSSAEGWDEVEWNWRPSVAGAVKMGSISKRSAQVNKKLENSERPCSNRNYSERRDEELVVML